VTCIFAEQEQTFEVLVKLGCVIHRCVEMSATQAEYNTRVMRDVVAVGCGLWAVGCGMHPEDEGGAKHADPTVKVRTCHHTA
jgi:hypothetical protein